MKKLLALLLLVTMFSCDNKEIVTNDEDFKIQYIDPFIELAEGYNVHINYYPVNIEYVNVLPYDGEDVAGLADWESLTIYFNTSHEYWNSDAREVLIYHELAHYFLSKVHIDESVSCDVPFSFMSLWSAEKSPTQFEYWTSGEWRNMKEYYMKELFNGSHVWKEYPQHEDILSHDIASPCWN